MEKILGQDKRQADPLLSQTVTAKQSSKYLVGYISLLILDYEMLPFVTLTDFFKENVKNLEFLILVSGYMHFLSLEIFFNSLDLMFHF